MKEKVVMTYSAGVDSIYILSEIAAQGHEINILHIDFGHPACTNERNALAIQIKEIKKLFPKCKIIPHFISLVEFNKFASDYVSTGYVTHKFTENRIADDLFFPARNALMASTTFFLAQCVKADVVICPFTPAIHYTDEELPDLGPKIISLYEKLGEIYNITVKYPYGFHIEVDDDSDTIKNMLQTLGKENTLKLLNMTYSCLRGENPVCNTCVNCLRRENLLQRISVL